MGPAQDGMGAQPLLSLVLRTQVTSVGSSGQKGQQARAPPPGPVEGWETLVLRLSARIRPHVDSSVLIGNRLWLVGVEK